MAAGLPYPKSLCSGLLQRRPWLRLIGAWVVPQHLHLFDAVIDGYKLDGRVTLQNPKRYLTVLDAYLNRTPLGPHAIGSGPAGVHRPMEVDEDFFKETLRCDKNCMECEKCRGYWEKR
jgi:hypothetical protein